MEILYFKISDIGEILIISTQEGDIENALILEEYPSDIMINSSKYLYINDLFEIIPINPEDSFDYDLCSAELLKRFAYEAYVYCIAECTLIQSMVATKQKPFYAIAQANAINQHLNKYPYEIVDGIDIYDTYNKLIALFLEQGIDLNNYLQPPIL
jgi:hypothetical protein